MEVANKTRGVVLSRNASYAKTFLQRLRGLMFYKQKKDLVIETPRESTLGATIHTHFMNYPLDVLWLDEDKNVVDFRENIQPTGMLAVWQAYKPKRPAKYIVELSVGKVGTTQPGDKIEFRGTLV